MDQQSVYCNHALIDSSGIETKVTVGGRNMLPERDVAFNYDPSSPPLNPPGIITMKYYY